MTYDLITWTANPIGLSLHMYPLIKNYYLILLTLQREGHDQAIDSLAEVHPSNAGHVRSQQARERRATGARGARHKKGEEEDVLWW